MELGEELAPGVRALRFPSSRALNPLEGRLDDHEAARLARSLNRWQLSNRIDEIVTMCGAPYWAGLARYLKQHNGWPLVYDLIDLHRGFSTMLPGVVDAEESLLGDADLVTVTSVALEERARRHAVRVRRLPNACEWERWSQPQGEALLESLPRPIVGYFGAISEWFDSELVESLAAARPHWSFVLVGSSWGGSVGRLGKMPNVHLLGEQPYERLPGLASEFDVGIIPFRDTPLTRATDPVKVYEMLALGLRVVATPLPELGRFASLVDVAASKTEFLDCLDRAVRLPDGDEARAARRSFAYRNRWKERAKEFVEALTGMYPRVSIVIATHNNIPLTRMCLESIRSRTEYPNYEVIVVDNGSTDGSAEYLEEEASRWSALRVVRNGENRGFAAATNQGLRVAEGEILVLLNNDTVVTRGWLCSMVRALTRHPTWGLVGAVTNAIGNEARIPVGYKELSALAPWAEEYVWRNRGKSFSIGMVALFCAAMRRDVWEEVGELDERFEVGMFEDDDYCRRAWKAGFEIRCLRDCFVHHWHQASFRLLSDEEYQRVYEANRRRFQEKWSGEGAGQRSGAEGNG
ncbi:MAG: glycosyltransferase [Acidobacteria bacterium]|nr:glycosyltransferase [Acidobacteriota bacterium]